MRLHARSLSPVVLAALVAVTASGAQAPRAEGAHAAHTALRTKPPALPCLDARESGLPLPSKFAKDDDPAVFQSLLSRFLTGNTYERLGWCEDKTLRDTGPYIDGSYYGTHPVVRVWYSPSFARWLVGGRKGEVPDGATIVKEQFDTPPAGQYAGWTPAQLRAYFFDHYDWTVMIRDRQGAADGWYWAEAFKGMQLDSYAPQFAVFNAGFGLYCLRCHASADKELTFSSTTNMLGMPGQPLTFRDDLSWFWSDPLTPPPTPPTSPTIALLSAHAHAASREEGAPLLPRFPGHPTALEELESTHPRVFASSAPRPAAPPPAASAEWTEFFGGAGVEPAPHPFPGENYDHVVSPPVKPQHFVTSDQCFGCHSGNRYGNVMLWADTALPEKPLVNVSPYGEWRWSPMGLAGRDPIFHAQLESEIAFLRRDRPEQEGAVVDLCFSCHGAMGERQLALDSGGKERFTPAIVDVRSLRDPRFEYGALARDGVSCSVCHHVASTDGESVMGFIANHSTGRFRYTPAAELSGPFEKPVTIPMNNSLGVKPVHDPYTSNPRLCGTCHTIELPVLDAPDTAGGGGHASSFEQATYLEWLNSAYENEIDPARHPAAKTCQDCHMKGELNGAAIQTQIAAAEDDKYPAADHRAPNAELAIPLRASGYARHQLQGLNVYLLALFDQWSDPLGVRTCDYMAGGCSGKQPASGIPFAMRSFLAQAASETATVAVGTPTVSTSPGNGAATTLTADVTVTNLTGHRFPSGVSFRRAFLDFVVRDRATGRVLFESGRTDSIGALVDMDGRVLPSERNGSSGVDGHAFQPHFWSPGAPITRSDQVEIYEELLKDASGDFTTSFVRQDEHFKDNRILPLGWRKSGPNLAEFNGRPLEATWPKLTGDDPHFADPLGARGQSVVRYAVPVPAGTSPGSVTVTAQLYYQAIPPYYLRQRFEQAPKGPATERLYYLTSGLDTAKTPFPGWKLLVAQATAP
jgi:hypothetical protein